MSFLLGLVPWWGRIAAIAAVLLAAMAFGAVKMHQHDQKAYDELKQQFEDFKDKVRVDGIAAKAAAKAQVESDQKRKENADEENSAALATLAGTIAKLRADSGRRPVPATPSCPEHPDAAARYRAEFERAYRDLAAGLRAEAQQRCDPTIAGLNTAKRWAQKR